MLTNMKRLTIIMLLALVPFLAGAQPIGKTAQNQEKYRQGQVIVKFKSKDAITLSNTSQQGRRGMAVSTKAQVNDVIQLLGITEAESLMPLTSKAAADGLHRAQGKHDLSQLYLLHFDSTKVSSVEEAVNALRQLDDVAYAEPNYIRHTFGTAADYTSASLYNEQWYLQAINMPYLWDQPIVSEKRPVIAIIDTGVTFAHLNLKGQWWEEREPIDRIDNDGNGYVDDLYGWDFINNTWDIYDGNGHGTHCAGIAAGTPNQGVGIVGANPDAKILDVKVMDANGFGDDATLIKGINYAATAGADILSMSLGGFADGNALREALENASQHCILVAAAGNESLCITSGHESLHGIENNGPSYPAAYPFVLAVQATDEQGALASFSNFDCDGPYQSTYTENYNYELRAPGVNMLSSYPTFGENLRGVGYMRMDGTSMACPLVAGAISRLMQCGKVTDFNSLRDLLIKTSGLTIDMKAAYDATTETMNAETFQCAVNGAMMTFHKISETTAQVGDGECPAIPTEFSGRMEIPNDVHGLLVTSVSSNAFKGCAQLSNVILPCHIETIGANAFNGCSQLSLLTLLSTTAPTCETSSFDDSAYTSCHIDVPNGCREAYQADLVWSRFAANTNELLANGEWFEKNIGDFSYSVQVTSAKNKTATLLSATPTSLDDTDGIVTIPEYIDGYQVTSIAYCAFAGQDWLKQVILPDCITAFGSTCFANSRNFETVNYPAALKQIGDFAFRDCISFKNGRIPGNVKNIGEAFENTGIEELILGEGVERVGIDAFTHCLKLKKVHIPSTLISIMESFYDLPNIEQIEVAEGNPFYDSRDNCNAIISTRENYLLLGCKNTVFPEGVTKIGGFWGTKGFTDLHLSKDIEFITHFRDCEDLENVTVDKYNERYYSPTGSNVVMEFTGSVEVMGRNAVIPEDAVTLVALSCYRNSHITSVTLPTAISIGDLVFAGCPITEVISLAKRPRYLPNGAFKDKYYDYYPTDNREPDKIFENATLYVPKGSKEIYEASSEWNLFEHIEELPAVVRGDTNNDGTLEVADYTALVDHMLGKAVNGYHPTAADADEDGRITARDFVSLNALLAGEQLENSNQYINSPLGLFMSNMYPGEKNSVGVSAGEVEALHVRIALPEGMSFANIPVTFNKAFDDDFVKEYSIDDNIIRVVICPAPNAERKPFPIYYGDAFLLNVNVADDIKPEGYVKIYYSFATHDGRLNETHTTEHYIMKEPRPKITLEFAPGQQWATFINENSCKIAEGCDAKSYVVSNVGNGNVYVSETTDGVCAGDMVLVGLNSKPEEKTVVYFDYYDYTYGDSNWLDGGFTETTGLVPFSTYVLYNDEFVLNSGTSVPACKGYLDRYWVQRKTEASPVLNIVIDGETTSLGSTSGNMPNSDVWFDLQGRRLKYKPSSKGIYFKNGKKVIIK